MVFLSLVTGCGATAVRPEGDGGVMPGAEDAVARDVGPRGDDVLPRVDVPAARVDAPADVSMPPRVDVPVPPPLDAGPRTECDPANHGLRCGPAGSGCGGGGGGVCSAASMCVCGPDERWRCSVTLPPGCDGGVSPTDAGPALMCSLTGTWRAGIESMNIFFVFTADGRWSGRPTPDGPALVEGTFTLAGDQLTLGGEMGMSSGGCSPTDRGVYRVQFRAGCAEMTLALRSEDCAPRGSTLAMLQFSRP